MTLTYWGLLFVVVLVIGSYWIGHADGVDEERERNARRRVHRINNNNKEARNG